MIKEIAPNIFVIKQTIGTKSRKFSVNIFVIAGENGIVFDSGFGTKKCMNQMSSGINEITGLMQARGMACSIKNAMTSHGHWDHFSGLRNLQQNCGLQILTTKKQLPKISNKDAYLKSFSKIDSTNTRRFFAPRLGKLHIPLLRIQFICDQVKIIDHNDTLAVDDQTWKIFHLPGHDTDDIVLYNENQGILLGGDLIIKSITTWLGPPKSNLEAYVKSLAFLLKLPYLKRIFPAHGSPIEKPHERITSAIEHRKDRTGQVLDLVMKAGDNGILFDDLFRKFYPDAKFYQHRTLSGWIQVTLDFLVKTGAVRYENSTSPAVYIIQENTFDLTSAWDLLIE